MLMEYPEIMGIVFRENEMILKDGIRPCPGDSNTKWGEQTGHDISAVDPQLLVGHALSALWDLKLGILQKQ
ncbi:o-sialoglycoprotein endopeptidase [Moniliophthora roreri]|nr:o-sialoglycoprotein endopeptidase [Moniliophthora roreri]